MYLSSPLSIPIYVDIFVHNLTFPNGEFSKVVQYVNGYEHF